MACIIFGAGSYYGLEYRPQSGDYIIAADGGWQYCKQESIVPDLLLGDFDSLWWCRTLPTSAVCRWRRMTAT